MNESFKFSCSRGNTKVECVLPETLKIGDNACGKCLIAVRPIYAGELIYKGMMLLAEETSYDDDYNLYVKVQSGEIEVFPINKYIHNVQIGRKRQIYSFCSFTNHSCDPNDYTENWNIDENGLVSYDVVALKDIKEGDEITCDYTLFDYSCHGHEISICMCGSTNCRGKMLGFHDLSIEDQLKALPDIFPPIFPIFLQHHNLSFIGEVMLPVGSIDFVYNKLLHKATFVTTQNIKSGDCILTSSGVILPSGTSQDDGKCIRICFKANESFFICSETHISKTLDICSGIPSFHYKIFFPLLQFLSGTDDALNNKPVNCKFSYQQHVMQVHATCDIPVGDILLGSW